MSEKILREGVFEPERTLINEIDQLSDSKIEVTAQRIVNLVVKYLINFGQGGGYEEVKMRESDVNEVYSRIQDQLGPSKKSAFLRWYSGTSYQERMLACPSSISIVKDVVSLLLQDILGNREHFVIDAGSGSGILQVAFYIQARRAGLLPSIDHSRGIEINKKAQQKSDKILRKLGVGHVIKANSTDLGNYKNFGTDFIHSYGNENLVDALDDVGGEPFIQNLQTLLEVYGERLTETQIIPYHVSFLVPCAISKNIVADGSILDTVPVIAFSGDVSKFLEHVQRKIDLTLLNNPELLSGGIFFPSDIQITPDSETVFLEELGKEWIETLFQEHNGVKIFSLNPAARWTISAGPYLKAIESK